MRSTTDLDAEYDRSRRRGGCDPLSPVSSPHHPDAPRHRRRDTSSKGATPVELVVLLSILPPLLLSGGAPSRPRPPGDHRPCGRPGSLHRPDGPAHPHGAFRVRQLHRHRHPAGRLPRPGRGSRLRCAPRRGPRRDPHRASSPDLPALPGVLPLGAERGHAHRRRQPAWRDLAVRGRVGPRRDLSDQPGRHLPHPGRRRRPGAPEPRNPGPARPGRHRRLRIPAPPGGPVGPAAPEREPRGRLVPGSRPLPLRLRAGLSPRAAGLLPPHRTHSPHPEGAPGQLVEPLPPLHGGVLSGPHGSLRGRGPALLSGRARHGLAPGGHRPGDRQRMDRLYLEPRAIPRSQALPEGLA